MGRELPLEYPNFVRFGTKVALQRSGGTQGTGNYAFWQIYSVFSLFWCFALGQMACICAELALGSIWANLLPDKNDSGTIRPLPGEEGLAVANWRQLLCVGWYIRGIGVGQPPGEHEALRRGPGADG